MPGINQPQSSGVVKLNFIRDLWKNNHSSIIDDDSFSSIVSRNICTKLNQVSGHINFNQTTSGFYSVLDNVAIIPSYITVDSTAVAGHVTDFRLEITLNDVLLATHFYEVGNTSKSSSKTVSVNDRVKLVRNFHGTNNYVKLQCFGSGAPDSFKIETVNINYSGLNYDNSYSSPTPEIVSFYPKTVLSSNTVNNSGINPTDGSYLSGPTNTSGTDHTWVYRNSDTNSTISGIIFDTNSLDLYFDTSGYFHNSNSTRNIDKAIFSLRYANGSGDNTNIQTFSSVRLYSDTFGEIGYGSGFHMHYTNDSGFTRVDTAVAFLENEYPSGKFGNTNFLSNFKIKLDDVPPNAKISAAQLDLYLSNDDILCMNMPAQVYHDRGSKNPYETTFDNSGYNRLREKSYDQLLFDIAYKPLHIGDTIDNKNFGTPLFWKNYYEQRINSYTYHNHRYNNSLYLQENEHIFETFDSSYNYSVLLQCSTSGNYSYLNGDPASTVLSKYNGINDPEFLLNIENTSFQFISYDNAGTPAVTNFPSYSNNLILITKNEDAGSDTLEVYTSDGVGNLSRVANHIGNLRSGSGTLYIGGSGLTDFAGYVHEYGISSRYLSEEDVDDFTRSRNRISSVLSDSSGLVLKTGNISGNLTDNFNIYFAPNSLDQPTIHQFHTPMIFAYNTLLTNPSAFTFVLDYENYTNNPSGMIVSGYYLDNRYLNNEVISVGFKKTLASGAGTVEIGPSEYSNIYSIDPTRLNDSQYLELYLNSPNNQNYSQDFRINSFNVSFDGWYVPPTGILAINFTTKGNTVHNDSFDMYLQNQVSSSGLDFYLQGHQAVNNYTNFHMLGTILEQSGMDMYMVGQQVGYDDFDMLVKGPIPYPEGSVPNEGTINLFTEGTTPTPFSGDIELFTEGTSVSGTRDKLDFIIISDFDYNSNINLYISSSMEELEDSINMYTPCSNETVQMFNMFMFNQHSGVDYELDFSMYSAYNMSGYLNMVIEGV